MTLAKDDLDDSRVAVVQRLVALAQCPGEDSSELEHGAARVLAEAFGELDETQYGVALGDVCFGLLEVVQQGAASEDSASVAAPTPPVPQPPPACAGSPLDELLLEFAGSMERLVWHAWNELSPGDHAPDADELRARAEQLTRSGDPADRDWLVRHLGELRTLTAALLAAIPQSGRLFAQHCAGDLAPEEVETLVRMAGKSWAMGWEAAYWRKYRELAAVKLTEDAIESSIRGYIARFVKQLRDASVRESVEGDDT
jgi:hypothetical protein